MNLKFKRSKETGDDAYEATSRSTYVTIRITSYGNADQHLTTVKKALSELDLRGFSVEVIST